MSDFRYIFFLGSHASLSASEIWRLLTSMDNMPKLVHATPRFLDLEIRAALDQHFIDRLGGIDRIVRVLHEQVKPYSASELAHLLELAPNTKLTVGIGTINLPGYSDRVGRDLKKILKENGHRARVVLPQGRSELLNSASVLFNKLINPPNTELIIINQAQKFILGRTTHIQNIPQYELRDTLRPRRDAKVGMMPPKLAQIMLNIAISDCVDKKNTLKIWDPFAGTGVVLQEGWLKDIQMFGSDRNESMVFAAQKNLDWISNHFHVDPLLFPKVWQQDITKLLHVSQLKNIDAIVSETYLGKPAGSLLTHDQVMERIGKLGEIYLSLLRQAKRVLVPEASAVLALPAWRNTDLSDAWHLLPQGFLDEILAIGYRVLQIIPDELSEHYRGSGRGSILYARPNAMVAREIFLLKRLV